MRSYQSELPTGSERRIRIARTMRDRYESGLTVARVAKAFGMSYGLARALLVEAGTPLRTRGGRTS